MFVNLIHLSTLKLGRVIFKSVKPKQMNPPIEAKKPGRGFITKAINAT